MSGSRKKGASRREPRALDESKAKLAHRLKDEGEHSVEEICSMLGVSRSTLYRYLGQVDGGGNRDDRPDKYDRRRFEGR